MQERNRLIAVLDDGDFTTWAADAALITLTPEEYKRLNAGDDKVMREAHEAGRGIANAFEMLNLIQTLVSDWDNGGLHDFTGAQLSQMRRLLKAFEAD